MTKLSPPPPTKDRFAWNRSDEPKCGICRKPITADDVHGRDIHLGYICKECGPHLCRAIEVMTFVQFHSPH